MPKRPSESVLASYRRPRRQLTSLLPCSQKDRTTRICCFSPCMEQVLRTVTALNDAGFTGAFFPKTPTRLSYDEDDTPSCFYPEITMYETLIRPHQVDVIPSLPSIDTISTQLKQSVARRETKRLRQIANSKQARGEKRKRDQVENPEVEAQASGSGTTADPMDVDATEIAQDGDNGESSEGTAAKKTKIETLLSDVPPAASSTSATVTPAEKDDGAKVTPTLDVPQPSKMSVSKAFPEVRGHTSYLTFAVLSPHGISAAVSSVPVDSAVPSDVQSTPTEGTPAPAGSEA